MHLLCECLFSRVELQEGEIIAKGVFGCGGDFRGPAEWRKWLLYAIGNGYQIKTWEVLKEHAWRNTTIAQFCVSPALFMERGPAGSC
jgi:hypothetical protein